MIVIENDKLYLTCSDQHAKKLDAIWVKSKKAYKLPNTLGALRELHRLGYDVAEYGKKKAVQRDKLLSLKTREAPNFDKRLRPYQNRDINFLTWLPHAAIFNEQRTGRH